MKVFISWSKPLSHAIAEAFSAWLPKVIQECRLPYVSSDTDKGEAWFQAITAELRESKVGVVFLTPQNANEEWIHLEAGAIYAALDKQLCPVLVNLKKTDYDGPLRNIQMTELGDKADMFKLLRTLNKNCDKPLDDAVLEASFETWWPSLDSEVKRAMAEHPDAKQAETRSVADKVDEVLLLVRSLSVQAAKAGSVEDDRARAHRAELDYENVVRKRRADMARFLHYYPEARYVVEDDHVIGKVLSVHTAGDGDFMVDFAPLDKDSGERLRGRASELTFTDVPF